MTEHCATCGKSLGTTVQQEMFGAKKRCIDCLTKERIHMMLTVLPDEDEKHGWDKLSEFEQTFLSSVRQQFVRKGTLSEKQYQILEQIYERHN